MKNNFAILIAVFMGIACSCNNPVKEEKTEIHANPITTISEANEDPHSESSPIELNNGTKWVVVPDMMNYIRTMESDINNFEKTKHTELDEFLKLGDSLQKNIDQLTSNCTMKGKAHDELHKWLLPYIDMVNKLNKSKDSNEAIKTFKEIKDSYKIFNNYFE